MNKYKFYFETIIEAKDEERNMKNNIYKDLLKMKNKINKDLNNYHQLYNKHYKNLSNIELDDLSMVTAIQNKGGFDVAINCNSIFLMTLVNTLQDRLMDRVKINDNEEELENLLGKLRSDYEHR